MSLLTLVGRAAFELMPNAFLKGVIYGMYSCAIRTLINSPLEDGRAIITLRRVLSSYIGLSSALNTLSQDAQYNSDLRSETLASVVVVTASLGLSFFGGFHIITADVIGHAAAAVTKVVLIIGIPSKDN
jgi:hypothetical protein